MRRRDVLALISGAAAGWPLALHAQQAGMPVVGFLQGLSSRNTQLYAPLVRKGMQEAGYTEGQNVLIEYRSAEGQYDRLPGLIADLIARKVAVMFAAGGTEPAKQAMAATSAIPIVFASAADPLKAGLVASLNRPGGHVTGISLIGSALEAKRLELLHQIVPGRAMIGALLNPNYPDANLQMRELELAAGVVGRPIEIVRVSTDAEMDAAFAKLVEKQAGALLVTQDVFFNSRRERLIGLAARYRLPAIYNQREYAELGGLISYGADFRDSYRQGGVYIGKILSGARPADLPVLQPTKFELVINAKTAKALGLEIPSKFLFTADDVFE
jgi:putative tryptophan/tyrosine transport system substrate-binding protein